MRDTLFDVRNPMARDAVLSDCGTFRFTLTREWDLTRPPMTFVMLNPSTADARQDDHTVRKTLGFARRAGCGSVTIVNLYAHRATDPRDLRAAGYPVGPGNDAYIAQAARTTRERCGYVVAGWGAHAQPERAHAVAQLVHAQDALMHSLGTTRTGQPKHPLTLAYATPLLPWEPATLL